VSRVEALADHALIAVSPLSGYRALRARWVSLPVRSLKAAALRAALFQLLAIAVFVSLTSAGRLVAEHLLSVMIMWSFGPALQALTVAAVARLAVPCEPLSRALALYYAGQGPWLFFLAIVAGVPVVAPGVLVVDNLGRLFTGFFVLLGVTVLWGATVSYGFFRAGLDLPRARAALATALFYVGYVSLIVGYYLMMNQIQPQLFGT
jgi:hypothetical protein